MIETLANWNAHLGCCCGMPECPEPIPCSSTYEVSLCGVAVYDGGEGVPYVGVLCASAATTASLSSDTGWVEYAPGAEFREIESKTLTHVQEREHPIAFPGQACGALLYTSGSYDYSFQQQGRTDGVTDYDWTETTTAAPGTDASSSVWPGVNDVAPGYIGYPGGDPEGFPEDTTVDVYPGVAIPQGGSWVDAGETMTWTRTSYLGWDTISIAYSTPYRIASARTALGEQSPDFPPCSSGLASALYEASPVSSEDDRVTAASITHAAVQYRVPTTHAGTYFKALFDVLDEPEGWETADPDPRSFHATDVPREWEGPGTGPQDDPSWELGAPYLIEPPSTPGTRRIVNFRYWCYRGPYGSKPQLMGDQVTLPP